MSNPITRTQAEAELAGLVELLLHKNISAEQADFISEMVKGVDVDVAGKVRLLFRWLLMFDELMFTLCFSVCDSRTQEDERNPATEQMRTR